MENYEINILKRNGDWKKYNQKDTSMSSSNSADQEELNHETENDDINVISFINEVNLIVNKLEEIENEKSNLKDQLKTHEKFFQTQKKLSESKLSKISKEIDMYEKTIGVIKSLKDF